MPGPLISAADLAGRLDDPLLRVADTRWYLGEPARGRAEYAAGHIPGARYVDLEADLSAVAGPGRHPLPDVADFAARLGEMGIGNQHALVAYDDRGGGVASRMWWMLRHLGHEQVAVVDGGLEAWVGEGRMVTTEVPSWPATTFQPRPRSGDVIDRDQVQAGLGGLLLLDARSGERYRGEEEPIDPAAGHIPTARTAPYEENLAADGRFLDPATLRSRFTALGVTAGSSSVSYCGSGVTACHNLLAMEIAGLGDAHRLYPGSWSDWSTAGLEVATGSE